MMSQMARSPAMQQIAGQLMEPSEGRGVDRGGGGGAGDGEPDFGALLQQMLPVVSQAMPCFVESLPWKAVAAVKDVLHVCAALHSNIAMFCLE